MKTIEVFVGSHCPSCLDVIRTITSIVLQCDSEVRILHRTTSPYEFVKRGVVITPATFVNGRLVFYGEFTKEALLQHLNHQSNNH